MNLDIVSEHRGEWHVVTVPAGIRVTNYTLPNRKAATAARVAIANGVTGFPWDVDKDGLKAALSAYQLENGTSLLNAVTRALAAVPAADPQGWNRSNVESRDAARAERRAFIAHEDADGYTEPVEVSCVEAGDAISFRYLILKGREHPFTGHPKVERGNSVSVMVRGTVTGEGRIMDRSGNNMYESVSGLRFPLDGATWHDEAGNSGLVQTPVTTDWLERPRRKPRRG